MVPRQVVGAGLLRHLTTERTSRWHVEDRLLGRMTNLARRITVRLRLLHCGLNRAVGQVSATGTVVAFSRFSDVNRFSLRRLQLLWRRLSA